MDMFGIGTISYNLYKMWNDLEMFFDINYNTHLLIIIHKVI